MSIKAIETRYKGYRFRSRLEARWAVFFDAIGVKWEYEPQGYDLEEWGYYLPDFWLPFQQCFVEIKNESLNPRIQETDGSGCTETEDAICLAKELCVRSKQDVAICWGLPEPDDTANDYYLEIPNVTLYNFSHIDKETIDHLKTDPDEFGGIEIINRYERFGGSVTEVGEFNWLSWLGVSPTANQLAAARSARFEHGESGAPHS